MEGSQSGTVFTVVVRITGGKLFWQASTLVLLFSLLWMTLSCLWCVTISCSCIDDCLAVTGSFRELCCIDSSAVKFSSTRLELMAIWVEFHFEPIRTLKLQHKCEVGKLRFLSWGALRNSQVRRSHLLSHSQFSLESDGCSQALVQNADDGPPLVLWVEYVRLLTRLPSSLLLLSEVSLEKNYVTQVIICLDSILDEIALNLQTLKQLMEYSSPCKNLAFYLLLRFFRWQRCWRIVLQVELNS